MIEQNQIEFKSVVFSYAQAAWSVGSGAGGESASTGAGLVAGTGVGSGAGSVAGSSASLGAGLDVSLGVGSGASSNKSAGTDSGVISGTSSGEYEPLALNDVSLAVKPGEFVAVLGANGSGKSTLARHINALLLPSSGSVLVAGMDTRDQDLVFDIRSSAGLLFQNPDSQIVASVVADDIAFGPENLCVPQPEIVQRVAQSLDAVKMGHFANRDPHHLSGGQKQRVCISGLLAMRPDILVLDEPGAMLDMRGRRGIRRVIRELNDEGMTVVLVTHFMEEAALAARMIVMDAGQIVMDGLPRQIFAQSERLRNLGLELPFTVRLAELLRERGLDVPLVSSPSELRAAIVATAPKADVRVGIQSSERSSDQLSRQSGERSSDQQSRQSGERSSDQQNRQSGERSRDQQNRQSGERSRDLNDQGSALGDQSSAYSGDQLSACGSDQLDSQPVIVLQDVTFSYPSDSAGDAAIAALSNISLSITRGSLVGVIGHSGSGKSTLLQLLSGLAQPDSGKVFVAGDDLSKRAARKLLPKKVGIAFQYPEHQLFGRSVAEDIGFAPRNAGLNAEQTEQRLRNAMELVGLEYQRFYQRSPFSLSGGEKRRVALAGIIAQDPDILLFDEPTNGLDPQTRAEIQQLISRLHKQGKTIILVSHDIDDIAALAERVIVLNSGEILMDGTPSQVFSHSDSLREVNLGVPQAAAFASELGLSSLPLTANALADAILASLAQLGSGQATSPMSAVTQSAATPAATQPAATSPTATLPEAETQEQS